MLDVVLVRVARWPNESAKIRKTAEFEKLRQMKITSLSYPNWSNQAKEPNKIRPNSTKYWNYFQLCKYHYTYIMYHIWLFSYFLLIFAKRQLTEFWKKNSEMSRIWQLIELTARKLLATLVLVLTMSQQKNFSLGIYKLSYFCNYGRADKTVCPQTRWREIPLYSTATLGILFILTCLVSMFVLR